MQGYFLGYRGGMSRYGAQLISEITAYYRTRCGVEITPEEAEEYLHSFAELYRCFKESIRQGFPDSKKDGGGVPPPKAVDESPTC